MRLDPLAGMTIQQTAELLGLSQDTIRRMIAKGELRARRTGGSRWVVSRQAVQDWWGADGETRSNVIHLRRRVG